MERTSLAATVVVPTHDHGAALLRSVPTALAQTVEDLEVIIVGDGMTPATRAAAEELARRDGRVRCIDNPKGARLGEAHRHQALEAARGEIVVYLCDDDLWRRNHVEVMREVLAQADFGHTLPVAVDQEGDVFVFGGDLILPGVVQSMMAGTNFIPLSCAGHTLDAYRRLPLGWHPGPATLYSDLHYFQQILTAEGLRPTTSHRATMLHLPASIRADVPAAEREAELDHWAEVVADDARWATVERRCLERVSAWRAVAEDELPRLRTALSDLRTTYDHVVAVLEGMTERRDQLESQVADAHTALEQHRTAVGHLALQRRSLSAELSRARGDLRRVEAALRDAGEELERVRWSATWRLRERVMRWRALRAVLRPLLRAVLRSPAQSDR